MTHGQYNQKIKHELHKMKNKKILIGIGILAVIVSIFAWAPRMDDKAVYDKVVQHDSERVKIAENICGGQLEVSWIPFGRFVSNCEIGYFVTFWGKVI